MGFHCLKGVRSFPTSQSALCRPAFCLGPGSEPLWALGWIRNRQSDRHPPMRDGSSLVPSTCGASASKHVWKPGTLCHPWCGVMQLDTSGHRKQSYSHAPDVQMCSRRAEETQGQEQAVLGLVVESGDMWVLTWQRPNKPSLLQDVSSLACHPGLGHVVLPVWHWD